MTSRLLCAALAILLAGSAARADDLLVLKDGRRIPVRQLVRRGSDVLIETTRGEHFSVPGADVVSPPFASIPEMPSPAPNPPSIPGTDKATPAVATKAPEVYPLPDLKPLGHAGGKTVKALDPATAEFVPMPDRWRFGFPAYERYQPPQKMPWISGSTFDPYNQNVLKADYPTFGNDVFLNLNLQSNSNLNPRTRGNGVASSEVFFNQNVVAGFEIFKGDTVFQPKDWSLRVTGVGNTNALADRGPASTDHGFKKGEGQISLEEGFVEKRLAVLGPSFDFVSLRAGTQAFTSDFRGYVFSDNQLGVRLFGNAAANRYQYNVAWFPMRIREAASQLHSFDSRNQDVFVGNVFVQDVFTQGYTLLFNVHYNRDRGFPGRDGTPASPRDLKATYLGVHGDGRIGGFNVSHAFYEVFGSDDQRQLTGGQDLHVNAQMAALEISRDADWKRYRLSVLYASGDDDPNDDQAKGFDMITDNPNLAGGGFSFWDQQALAVSTLAEGTSGKLFLKDKFSLFPSLRSKFTDGSNFVNPGLLLLNAGVDLRVSPKLKTVLNGSYLRVANTASLQQATGSASLDAGLGFDLSAGVKYRPLLSENVFFVGGAAVFLPRGGLADALQGSQALHSFFVQLQLAY
jgi:hypothetical protein